MAESIKDRMTRQDAVAEAPILAAGLAALLKRGWEGVAGPLTQRDLFLLARDVIEATEHRISSRAIRDAVEAEQLMDGLQDERDEGYRQALEDVLRHA